MPCRARVAVNAERDGGAPKILEDRSPRPRCTSSSNSFFARSRCHARKLIDNLLQLPVEIHLFPRQSSIGFGWVRILANGKLRAREIRVFDLARDDRDLN
jgi:hypothetical protein